MPGMDYIAPQGLSEKTRQWIHLLAPYSHRLRPIGHPLRSALLVLDMQHFFLNRKSRAFLPAASHIAPTVGLLVRAFKQSGSPVLFTRHALAPGESPGRMGDWWGETIADGSQWADLHPWAHATSQDTVLRKTRYSAFRGTALEELLVAGGVDTLVLCGVMTHLCCETSARDAFQMGFHVLVAADATASQNEDLHLSALRSMAHGFAQVKTSRWLVEWKRDAWTPGHGPRAMGATAGSSGPGEDSPARTKKPAVPGTENDTDVDVVVVGAGPAGLAASIQLARTGLSFRLLEATTAGGLLRQAHLVENYPGMEPMSGPRLVEKMLTHARELGVHPESWRVDSVSLLRQGVLLISGDRTPIRTRAVLLSTGTQPRKAGFTGEDELHGRGLFYHVRTLLAAPGSAPGDRVAVIGAGDAAFDQACTLLQMERRVTMLMRGSRPVAMGLLVERAKRMGLQLEPGLSLKEAAPVGSAILLHLDGGHGSLEVDQVLVSVGRIPALPGLPDRLCSHPPNRIQSQGKPPIHGAVPCVHLAGDVKQGYLRQAAIAAGDGLATAMRLIANL